MFKYEFMTKDGKVFVATGKDADRARIAAKREAGDQWSPSAKLVRILNTI